ncbi:hypothetical protein PUR29_29755 [Methylobacterium ajmalii]
MVDLMRRDMETDRGHAHAHGVPEMPPGRSAEPLIGGKPKPALEKVPEEKGSGPNVTAPAQLDPRGALEPGSAHNRDHQ